MNGDHRFDRVVIAAHPDQALRMLADPTAAEREVLGGFALLEQPDGAAHRRLAPAARGRRPGLVELPARRLLQRAQPAVHVTYHLNRLQALREPVEYCVTLNQTEPHQRRATSCAG